MAGSSIRNALIFGIKSFEHQAHVKALLNQGCKVTVFVRDATEIGEARSCFSDFFLAKMDELGAQVSDDASKMDQNVLKSGALEIKSLESRDDLMREGTLATILGDSSAAPGQAAPDLLVFNLGCFDDDGIIDLRQTSLAVRQRIMNLNGHLLGQIAKQMGVEQLVYTPSSGGLNPDEESGPPAWWCDYCDAACPAAWSCCSKKRAQPSAAEGGSVLSAGMREAVNVAAPPLAPPDEGGDAIMGTLSVTDLDASWVAPEVGEKLISSVPGAGVSSFAAVDAQIAAWRSEILAGHEGSDTEPEAAEALAQLLTTPTLSSTGTALPGGSIQSSNHVASFSGMLPSQAGATPAPRSVVQSIEDALKQTAEEANEAVSAKEAVHSENRK